MIVALDYVAVVALAGFAAVLGCIARERDRRAVAVCAAAIMIYAAARIGAGLCSP